MSEEKTTEQATEQQAATKQTEAKNHVHLPKVTFSTFMLSMASSALVQLGEVPNPDTGESDANLPLAKHSIDIIEMLDDKIKNGLAEEESKLLEGILYELRMKYIIKSR